MWIKNNWKTIALTILAIVVVIAIIKSCNIINNTNTVYVHDTTIVTKLQVVTERDTIIKWYERVIYRDAKPDTVFWSKVDTAFILRYKDHDVVISLTKHDCDLDIFALNEQGLVLKRYQYKNVCGDFSVTSQTNNLFIKSAVWDWNRVNLYFEHANNFLWQNHSYEAGLSTGVTFMGKVSADVSIDYNTIKQLEFKQKIGVKF